MTKAQESIMQFISKYYPEQLQVATICGKDQVIVTDRCYAVNIFGDILDGKTKKIIAISNLPHDLSQIGAEQQPTDWIVQQ